MRNSYYNIIEYIEPEKDIFLILNTYTQAIDLINKDVHDYLVSNGKKDSISEETKEKLLKRGFMTHLSKNEEIELVKQISLKNYDDKFHKMFNFHFVLSYDCNFRCRYCYENEVLVSRKKTIPQHTMSLEYLDKTFEIISELVNSNKGSKNINLYGGEPFLLKNKPALEYIFKKGKELKLTFFAISNGYDLDSYFDLIQDYKSIQFQITVDGIEQIHNYNRPHLKNKDSFTKIINNINHLLNMNIKVSLRINTDLSSISRLNELIALFKQKGWYDSAYFRPYVALLRPDVSSLSESSLLQYDYFNLIMDLQHQGLIDNKTKNIDFQEFGVSGTINALLNDRIPLYRSTFCGAQTNNIIFDPLGDIYSCWDVVGLTEHKIGTYTNGLSFESIACKKWYKPGVKSPKCSKCKFVLFCGGGCFNFSLRKEGEIKAGNCAGYQNIFRYLLRRIYIEKIKDNIADINI